MRAGWCVLAMMAGLACVVAGLVLGAHAQWTILACAEGADCPSMDGQKRFAVELSLVGVILASLSTAALAALLMRQARPPLRRPPPRPVRPSAEPLAVAPRR